jgi:trehalose 6-phosphate synthase
MPVGGLATGMRGALRKRTGSLWFGWSGAVVPVGEEGRLVKGTMEGIQVAGLPMTQREISSSYRGFCNEVLWPLFHGFPEKMRIDRDQETCYREVAARFASTLRPMLRSGDTIWIHDYHFISLGRELRRLGWTGPLGYFLHIPFPPYDLWQLLPEPRDFLEAMHHYDLVGFQTMTSLDNYVYCCKRLLNARRDGARLVAGGRRQRAGVYPIGIDPTVFLPREETSRGRGRRGELTRVIRGRRLILGVDRLDYTKGIPERILAFESLVKRFPEWRKKVSFVQIASPSRSRVRGYVEQKRRVDHLVGRVNGELADHDWVPIRYLYRSYPTETLARFYREAAVGLVTPLRDGMNLIAKEFVAAQDPESPGVLVLSRFAGAAEELLDAVLVNPYIPADAASGIARALSMPLQERRRRHAALLGTVLKATADAWSRGFLEDLARETRARTPARTRRG